MHYSGRSVIYGYVIFGAFWELSRPLSTLFFLWGAHRIVWNEVEHRFTEKQKYNLWLGAKVLMLITFLVIIFYWLLYIAFASVWVRFASLDTIADIGTRWSQFWISMTGLFLGYSILIFATAAATLYQARFRLDGHLPWVRTSLSRSLSSFPWPTIPNGLLSLSAEQILSPSRRPMPPHAIYGGIRHCLSDI